MIQNGNGKQSESESEESKTSLREVEYHCESENDPWRANGIASGPLIRDFVKPQ